MDASGVARFLYGDPITVTQLAIFIHRRAGDRLTFSNSPFPPGTCPVWELHAEPTPRPAVSGLPAPQEKTMAKVSEIYSGTYLNAAELGELGKRRRATVQKAYVEEIGQDRARKIVLALVSSSGKPWPKDVVVNRTNADQLAAVFGDDIAGWTDKSIQIWADNVPFRGKQVPGVKMLPLRDGAAPVAQAPKPAPPAPAPLSPAPPVQEADWDDPPGDAPDGLDEIPFC